jgi:hypothetical protein
VPSGPYEGLVGLITPYTATVTARTTTNSEVRMQRTLQTVAVPVFQFGIFSDTDLSFHAGPDFNFGGCPKLCPRQTNRNQLQQRSNGTCSCHWTARKSGAGRGIYLPRYLFPGVESCQNGSRL